VTVSRRDTLALEGRVPPGRNPVRRPPPALRRWTTHVLRDGVRGGVLKRTHDFATAKRMAHRMEPERAVVIDWHSDEIAYDTLAA
jgi:hypothetical protein